MECCQKCNNTHQVQSTRLKRKISMDRWKLDIKLFPGCMIRRINHRYQWLLIIKDSRQATLARRGQERSSSPLFQVLQQQLRRMHQHQLILVQQVQDQLEQVHISTLRVKVWLEVHLKNLNSISSRKNVRRLWILGSILMVLKWIARSSTETSIKFKTTYISSRSHETLRKSLSFSSQTLSDLTSTCMSLLLTSRPPNSWRRVAMYSKISSNHSTWNSTDFKSLASMEKQTTSLVEIELSVRVEPDSMPQSSRC